MALPRLSLVDTDPAELSVDALVVGVFQRQEGPAVPVLAPGAASVDAALGGKLATILDQLGATGALGEVTKVATFGAITAPVLAAVGLGKDGEVRTEALRRATASVVRALAGRGTVAVALPVDEDEAPADALRAIAEGALLGGYRFESYRSRPAPGARKPVGAVVVLVPDAGDRQARAELRRSAAVAGAVRQTRDWVNTPPNELRPPQFADAVVAAVGSGTGVKAEVLDEKALRKGGYGGILAVGGGSAAPPRMVRLSYRPRGARSSVALVGKGITFDSGGLAIKPYQGMWEMKSDMAGAAAVAAAFGALVALKAKVSVTAYLPMAENMLSGSAFRPGDVLTMYGGKKVEIFNTDAEGRLILADAIVRALEDEPDYLVETSTLTGGQVVALGHRVSGVMGTPELCERVQTAGDRVGEATWPMPLPEDVRKGMDSDVADLAQCHTSLDRAGHMLQGGWFLAEFVPDGLPWAHLDVAGPSWHAGEPYGYVSKGGTGVPTRTLIELVEDIAVNG